MDNEIVIYTERLKASEAQIADFLDHKLDKQGTFDRSSPNLGFFKMVYQSRRDSIPSTIEVIEREWQELRESPPLRVDALYLRKYWSTHYANRWIIWAALHSSGPLKFNEYDCGYVELKSVPEVEGLTDVVIVSKWPVMKAYWEWVAKCIRYEFLRWESATRSDMTYHASQSAAVSHLDYKADNMRRLTVGYEVDRFKIYREFWKTVEEVEQFTENKSQWILGELTLDLRREAEGLWLLTVQNLPESLRGQIELSPGQNPNETNIIIYSAEQFGTIGHLMTFFAKELKQFAENRGLLYPPRSGTAQTIQPTKENMVRDDMQSEASDLFLWEYLNRNKLSMILEKTPLADFTNWLEQQASFPYGKSLRTENGHISLQSARRAHRTNNDLVWEIGAIYFHSDKDDSSNTLKSDPPLSAISFELIKLGENLKVIAACHQLAVKRYFDQLLTAIARDWPSAQASIRDYLQGGQVDEAQPVENRAIEEFLGTAQTLERGGMQIVPFNTLPGVKLSPEGFDNLLKEKPSGLIAKRLKPNAPEATGNPDTWDISEPQLGLPMGRISVLETGDTLAIRFWRVDFGSPTEAQKEYLKEKYGGNFRIADPDSLSEPLALMMYDEIANALRAIGALTEKIGKTLTVTSLADEVEKFLNLLPKSEYIYERRGIGDEVLFNIRKQNQFFGSWVIGPGDKCGPTQGDSQAWSNLVLAIWANLALVFGDEWKGPRPDLKAIRAEREASVSAASELQASGRDYEFENKVFIPLWNGLSLEESMPIELIDRRLRERTYEKGKIKIKVERVEYDGAVGRYYLYTSNRKAEITLITQDKGSSITFVRPTDCELSEPNGDAYKEFVSAVIWWARHDYQRVQETKRAALGAGLGKGAAKDEPDSAIKRPKWWPQRGATKLSWKAAYKKIRPLHDKGMNSSQIAKELKMNRDRISRILQWALLDSEAHN